MLLKKQDAELFYGLYFKVLKSYFNSLKKTSSEIRDFDSLSLEDLMNVRNKLFDDINYLNYYSSKNPDAISAEEMDIVKKWKFFIKKLS